MAKPTNDRLTEINDLNLAQSFELVLARELLESQAQRTLVLGAFLAVSSVIISITAFNNFNHYGWHASEVPLTVLSIVLTLTLYEFVVHRFIRGVIREGRMVPTWGWCANIFVEMTAMSFVLISIQDALSNPIFVLSTPPLVAYFLFIILSTLNLNVKLSLFAGSLAAIQYGAIVAYTFSSHGSDPNIDVIFMTPSMYIAKSFMLFIAGVGAAFVTRELQRRQYTSILAIEQRDYEQQANKQKSRFLADMSHEIRTPLNSVIGYAQLLETEKSFTAEQRRALEAIRIGGRHLLDVVNDVLDLSKIEAGGHEFVTSRFNLATMLKELSLIFAAQCAEKRVEWIFDRDIDIVQAVGDEFKLRQALTNLLGNAVKFTESGHVLFRITMSEETNIEFLIRDTGCGISEDKKADIFNPFAQDASNSQGEGTGLGLAISYRHIELMGGELKFKSDEGLGSCFWFSLPLKLQEETKSAVVPNNSTVQTSLDVPADHDVRALIVDDLAVNRDILMRMLARVGIHAQQVETGAVAIDMIEKESFDIIFMDIRLADMSGIQVVQHPLQYRRAKPKFVAVSASALSHQQAEYLDAGFDDFIDKPVHMERLYQCISQLLCIPLVSTSTDVRGEVVSGDTSPDYSTVRGEIRNLLIDAARRQNVTELKLQIKALEAQHDVDDMALQTLRAMYEDYDMDGILSVLKEPKDE